MDTRKRGRSDFGLNANGGLKKSKPEMDSLSSGIGSKSKPCTKFFSMAGCPFGENCHFLHFVPGGYKVVAQMMNLPPTPTPKTAGPTSVQNGSSPAAVKTKLCNKFNTPEGCKYNDKCNFAHGESELGKPILQSHEDTRAIGPVSAHFGARPDPHVPGLAASFGASATAKISVDASLAGAIIGKGGVNSKQICRQTGAKLSIRDHEADPNLRNIELEGSFEQIKQASAMVRELIVSIGSAGGAVNAFGGAGGPPGPGKAFGGAGAPPGLVKAFGGAPGQVKAFRGAGGPPAPVNNFKTKLCENFSKGSCTFGDRCHFAHGGAELRQSGL